MPGLLDSVLIALALSGAWFWTHHPTLAPLTLQLVAALVAIYLIALRRRQARWHHVLPRSSSLEAALLAGATALLIGRTGGLDSPFLPLAHILLFVTVLTLDLGANVIHALGLTVFLWSSGPHPLNQTLWLSLASVPAILPVMILARIELETARAEKQNAQHLAAVLAGQETRALIFLNTMLRPKLAAIRTLLLTTSRNAPVAVKQLEVLETAAAEVAHDIDEASER